MATCASIDKHYLNMGASFFKDIVFLDLESTGLYKRALPSPRITEICLRTYMMEEYLSAVGAHRPPRSSEIRNWQINPCLDEKFWSDEGVSGLSVEHLKHKPNFLERWPDVISFFEKDLRKPACILAHNGRNFDFQLLKDEMYRCKCCPIPDSVYAADTIHVIEKVESIYKRQITDELKKKNVTLPQCSKQCKKYFRGSPVKRQLLLGETFCECGMTGIFPPSSFVDVKNHWSAAKRNRMKLKRTSSAIYVCCDRMSYSLSSLYNDIFGQNPPDHHEADADCRSLVNICSAYGEEFLDVLWDQSYKWSLI